MGSSPIFRMYYVSSYNLISDRVEIFISVKCDMRKCRNWQTSKTKDLVSIALVWVQVPSSAFNLSRKMLIVAVFSGFFIIYFSKKGQKRGRVFSLLVFFIQLFHFPCFPLLFLLLHLELSLFCHQTYDSQFVENL